MGLIQGIHHIALKCEGYARFTETVAFYRDVLEMPVIRTWGEGDTAGAMLDSGAGIMEISANGDASNPKGSLRHIAFQVDSVEACLEKVRAAGYSVTMEPKDHTFASQPPYPVRIAFCIGPVGEEIEFFHER